MKHTRHRQVKYTAPAWDYIRPCVFNDGCEARLEGKSRASCPYPRGGAWGHYRETWLAGWDDVAGWWE